MKQLVFKKLCGRWFIDIPEWTADIADLEMVMGADTMLDNISPTLDEVKYLEIKEEGDDDGGWIGTLTKISEDEEGGTYFGKNGCGWSGEVWLCNVTKYILGCFPNEIKFRTTHTRRNVPVMYLSEGDEVIFGDDLEKGRVLEIKGNGEVLLQSLETGVVYSTPYNDVSLCRKKEN